MARAVMSRAVLWHLHNAAQPNTGDRFSTRCITLSRQDRARNNPERRLKTPNEARKSRLTGCRWHLAKGDALVDSNILRHAQHPLGDNVRHDLVRAACDP